MKLLFPILFTLMAVATFILGVNPLFNSVKDLKVDIAKYNTALSNSTNLQKTEDALIKSYNEIKNEDKDRLNKLLPGTVNNIQFILEIERIANLHNMPIRDVKFDPKNKDNTPIGESVIASDNPEDDKPYGIFPISFSTEGDYDSFVSFLRDLEHNLRLVDIKSISFSVSDPTSSILKESLNPNSYRYLLEVETYWLR